MLSCARHISLNERLILDEVLREHGHGLRNVDQRRVGLGRAGHAARDVALLPRPGILRIDARRPLFGRHALHRPPAGPRGPGSGRGAGCVRRLWAPHTLLWRRHDEGPQCAGRLPLLGVRHFGTRCQPDTEREHHAHRQPHVVRDLAAGQDFHIQMQNAPSASRSRLGAHLQPEELDED